MPPSPAKTQRTTSSRTDRSKPVALLAADCLEYMRSECQLADSSLAAYRCDLDRFAKWTQGKNFFDYSVKQLAEYLNWLREQEYAPSSIGRNLVSVSLFYRYLQLKGLVYDNPAELLGSPKFWERVPNAMSPTLTTALLNEPRPYDAFYRRDRALLELMYATGCRVSEISDLKVWDIHLVEGYCYLGESRDRAIPISVPVADAVSVYQQSERLDLSKGDNASPWLFLSRSGKRLRREAIWELVKKYAVRCGAPTTISPHTLRHTFAVHMLASGQSMRRVQVLLGHANYTTTQVYHQVRHT